MGNLKRKMMKHDETCVQKELNFRQVTKRLLCVEMCSDC